MVRRHAATLRAALMVADGITAALLFVALSVTRFGSGWITRWDFGSIDAPTAALTYAFLWPSILWLSGLYRLRARWTLRSELVDLVRAGLLAALLSFAVLYLARLPDVSRLFLFMLFPAQVVLTLVSRYVLRLAFNVARARGLNSRYMLVVGAGTSAQAFADRVERHADLGLRVVGHLRVNGEEPHVSRPVLGEVDEIEEIVHQRVVDEVAICLPRGAHELTEPIARLCEEEGKIVRLPLTDLGLPVLGGTVEEFDGVSVMSFVHGPDRTLGLIAKRVFDLLVALLAFVLLSPLIVAVALTILARDGRPVFFRQTRVGLHGRPFEIVKFRTMVADAEHQYEALANLSDTRGAAFKMRNDPRVTLLGRWLRKTSLDELPQLWNVVRGEMSIVGPRPAPPREVAEYDIWHRRRLSMKPGITGLWQVEARFDEEFDNRARLDLAYIDRWSFWLDLKIIARTIPALVANPGH